MTEKDYEVEVLGIAQVVKGLGDAVKGERAKVAEMCYAALTKPDVTPSAEWIGRVQTKKLKARVKLGTDIIKVLDGETQVTCHKTTGVSTIAAVHKSNGCLVYIGRCQVRSQRVGVVLQMDSEVAANQLVVDFLYTREERTKQRISLEETSAPLPSSPEVAAAPDSLTTPQAPKTLQPPQPPQAPQTPQPPQALQPPQPPQAPQSPKTPQPPKTPQSPTGPSPITKSPIVWLPKTKDTSPRLNLSPRPLPAIPTTVSPKPFAPLKEFKMGYRPVLPPNAIAVFPPKPALPSKPALSPTKEGESKAINANVAVVPPQPNLTPKNEEGEPSKQSMSPPATELAAEPYYTTEAQTIYPPPKPGSCSGLDPPASGKAGDDDADEYYLTMGIKAEESERIYTRMTAPRPKRPSSDNMEKQVSQLLSDEHKYLGSVRRIKEARQSMAYRLNYLLRGIDTLAEIHESMYVDLYTGQKSYAKIAEVITSRKEQLKPYVYYLMNAPNISKQLNDLSGGLLKKYPQLKDDIRCSWKRLNFYFLSLEKMLGDASDEEKPVMMKAVDMLREMNREGDAGCHTEAIRETPFPMQTLGSLVLHSSMAIKEIPSKLKNKAKFRVFLFKDKIIVTTPNKNLFNYQEHIPLNQVHFLSSGADNGVEFVLEMAMGGQKKNRKFTFRFDECRTKEAWVNAITDLLKEEAEEIKEHSNLRSFNPKKYQRS